MLPQLLWSELTRLPMTSNKGGGQSEFPALSAIVTESGAAREKLNRHTVTLYSRLSLPSPSEANKTLCSALITEELQGRGGYLNTEGGMHQEVFQISFLFEHNHTYI